MARASERLREERRKTLGDWVAFCLGCGHAQRYVAENEEAVPRVCPTCGGEMRHRCPACDARFSSVFSVECEACGTGLRQPTLFGAQIRKRGR